MNGRAAIGIWLETDHPRVLNDRIWLSNPAGLHGEQADYLLTCTPLNTFGFPGWLCSIEDLVESLMKGREFTPWDLVGQNAEVPLERCDGEAHLWPINTVFRRYRASVS